MFARRAPRKQQDAFVAKVDAFARGLDADEQATLLELFGGDDVAGFGADAQWPGLRNLVSPKGWVFGKDDAGDVTTPDNPGFGDVIPLDPNS